MTVRNADLRSLANCKELNSVSDPAAVREVDLSFNKIDSCAGLAKFANITDLVLDNNSFSTLKTLPAFTNLHVLSLSNNSLRDLDGALAAICSGCPSIQHLNLIGNPANPMFSNPNKYEEFRAKIKIWLPSLETLDGTDFTKDSATIAKNMNAIEQLKAKVMAKHTPPQGGQLATIPEKGSG